MAVTQWKIGRLSEKSKINALKEVERELNSIDECWKEEFRSRRRKELLDVKTQLCEQQPARKKIRKPSWAWQCPWEVGSVLQFKLRYPIENNPFYQKYILLLVVGISETPPDKIPCECISVELYNWYSEIPPVQQIESILQSPPSQINYVTKSGAEKKFHCILPLDSMIREGEMRCISKIPLSNERVETTPVYSPMNTVFEELIVRSLMQ